MRERERGCYFRLSIAKNVVVKKFVITYINKNKSLILKKINLNYS